jgi:hypothetical protein
MTAAKHVAAARLAIALAYWHARHARYQPSRLTDVRQCGATAVRQLRHVLEGGS